MHRLCLRTTPSLPADALNVFECHESDLPQDLQRAVALHALQQVRVRSGWCCACCAVDLACNCRMHAAAALCSQYTDANTLLLAGWTLDPGA